MASIAIEGLRVLISPESIVQKTNLDKFLNDVFSKKLQFHVDQDFTRCLQTAVENYVKDLFNEVMKLQEVQNELKKLEQSYKKSNDLFLVTKEVLPVGSSYEDTKNSFPDEFDYILIVLSAQRLVNRNQNSHFSYNFLRNITDILAYNVEDLTDYAIKFCENPYFDLIYKSFKLVGPACKLCFVLHKKIPEVFKDQAIEIYVDITPAIRVHDKYLPLYVDTLCSVKNFRDEILNTGSFIVIQNKSTRPSFTETEVEFMKSYLSLRHKKTYRLLKYLINGDFDEDKLREVNDYFKSGLFHLTEYSPFSSYFRISSYALKVLMINHHYSCRKDDSWPESACVLDILKNLQEFIVSDETVKIQSLNQKTYLTICYGKDVVQSFKKDLSELINMLISLSESNNYDFNEVAIVPLTKTVYKCVCDIRIKCQKAVENKQRKCMFFKILAFTIFSLPLFVLLVVLIIETV